MKTAWLCIWIALAAAEVFLTLWTHSVAFLAIAAIIPFMIAYNLLRARVRVAAIAQGSVEISQAA
ncbi:MAG TPA: hypothetical protein VHX60_08795 [Acidobacteriaceae bacterium]|jgi:hypothetical protein|nr:hypothetical protein [Acidobacteriaceae bacterium]